MSKSEISRREEKRQKISGLVKQSLGIRNIVKFRELEWDDLFEGEVSVGYLVLRRDGNVMSLYTLNRERKHGNFSSFDEVELVLMQRKYKRLAHRIEERLQKNGYAVKIDKHRCSRGARYKNVLGE